MRRWVLSSACLEEEIRISYGEFFGKSRISDYVYYDFDDSA
jgi:hypothetical protein